MRKWVIPITLFCMFIGFFTTQAIKVQAAAPTGNSDNRNEVLISLITNLESETAAQEARLTNLRQQIEQVISQSATGENQLSALQAELSNLQILAGMTPLVGPGIIISLDDYAAGLAASPNEDPNRFIIHYDKLLNIVNDLRAANAEAISINGQRIIASSEIRCVGNVILVNTTRLAPPFLISAIGDPTTLEKTINSSVSYETLRVTGFPVSYQIFADTAPTLVTIPAYTGSFPTANMKIVEMERE